MSSIKTLSIISICIVLFILGWNNLFISEENREVTQFNSIYSSGPINVYIESGEEESVRVRADNNIHDKIVVEVIEGELKINENSHIHRERVLDVYVNYVSLDSIHASGASTITRRSSTEFKIKYKSFWSFRNKTSGHH